MFDTTFSTKKKPFFKNVPPSTTVPGGSPGHSPTIPSPTRANIGHLIAILADVRGKQIRNGAILNKLYSTYTYIDIYARPRVYMRKAAFLKHALGIVFYMGLAANTILIKLPGIFIYI